MKDWGQLSITLVNLATAVTLDEDQKGDNKGRRGKRKRNQTQPRRQT
ncbi:hypothetical protein [Paenibacillus piscarius]|nr:hypothetical protein [Paenibacillus piscarius]